MTPIPHEGPAPTWPDSPRPHPLDPVTLLFERQVEQTPDAPAILCEDRTTTYRQLASSVHRLARHLRRRGVGRDARVGLVLGRSERMIVSMLAVLEAGGAYVPISPDYPAGRVAYVLGDAEPALLLAEERHAPLLGSMPFLSWDAPEWNDESDAPLDEHPDPRQLAYVMYTSGSTGLPKGVMVEHRNLGNFIVWCHDEYRHSKFDIVYACTPYGFDLSNIELYFPLTIGRPMRLLTAPQMIGLQLRRDRNVLINTVPSLAQELFRNEALLDHVSVLNLGGEAIPPPLARMLLARAGLEVRNMYGPTEATSTSINYRMDGVATPEVLIGKPIANLYACVLDEDLQCLAPGSKGEICIGGYGVTRGYWKLPDLTRERFIPDPSRPGELMYRSGDIGMELPDGNFRYFGRNDNQIKIRGHRIELDEIALQLAAHPGVADAVAGVRGHDGAARLHAYVLAGSAELDGEALTAFLRDRVPPYMVPESIEILASFPLSPTGKVDRHALFA